MHLTTGTHEPRNLQGIVCREQGRKLLQLILWDGSRCDGWPRRKGRAHDSCASVTGRIKLSVRALASAVSVNGIHTFITSGPVVAMVWEGEGVIASARVLIGATKPLEAAPGTIRGDLAVDIGRNVVHGSDGPDTARFEIGLWFQPEELGSWQPADQSRRTES